MKTFLSLLTESLSRSVADTYDIVGKIGVSESLNHFELNMRNWVSAFFFFIAVQRLYLEHCDDGENVNLASMKKSDGESGHLLYIRWILFTDLEEINDSIMESVQGVFDVIEQDIGRGSIIPRTANHLELATLKWKVTFLDYKDMISGLALVTPYRKEYARLEKLSIPKAAGLSEDESEWLLNWMDNHLVDNDNDFKDT